MSSRYDSVDETDPGAGPPRSPLEPVPNRRMWLGVVAVLLATLVSVGAAFGFDVCALLHSVGLELDSCKTPPVVTPAAPPAPSPAAAGDASVEPAPK